MHSSIGRNSAIFIVSIVLLALPLQLLSQESGSSRRLIIAAELPEAPQPQFELSTNALSDSQDRSTHRPAQSPNAQGSSSSQASTQQTGTEMSQHDMAEPQQGSISGTVIAMNDDIIPGATVVIESPVQGDRRTVVANDNGAFQLDGLKPGIPYHITISANGFTNWTSPDIILNPGQNIFLTGSKLKIAGGVTSITVFSTPEQIAVEQVKVEEQQRVFGIIPNFYVVYDPNPVPLTTKLKFKLALRAATDPITFLGVAFFAGIDQAANTPDYVQGAKGYGQRIGADYTDGFTDIFIGGAILPTLLHQDPRYFYQGTGTKKSRALHALESPFICRGDNGRREPNYSSMGGDLAAGAISNIYYPATNRGPNLVFENALITSGARVVDSLVQEFVLRKFTPKAKN
jgi:Carboxypeptidase regulatory-like domain